MGREKLFALCIEDRDCDDLVKRKIYQAILRNSIHKFHLNN